MAVTGNTIGRQVRGLKVSFEMIIRFRRELKRHWPRLLLALLCALGYVGMRLAEPWPLKFVFDNVLIDQPLVTPFAWLNDWLGTDRLRVLLLAVGAVLLFAILRGIFYYFQNVLTTRVGQEVVVRIRQQLFAHVQRLSLGFHNKSSTGDLLMRFTGDINNLRLLLAATLLSLMTETIILVGFVTVMFIMNWQLALLAIVTMPTILFLLVFYSSRIRTAARKQRRREGELASRLHETLGSMHIVQMFTREREEEERLRSLNKRSLKAGMRATRLEGQLNQGVEISVAVGMALTIWVGANQVIDGRLTPGELLVFITYMQSFYRPMRRLSRVAERAAKASSCVDRITEVLDQVPEIEDGHIEADRLRGHIHFDNVSFAYDDDAESLRHVDLTIRPHQTVALVGPSGAGKSTLASLLPRLYDVSEGSLMIDDHDIRDYTLRSLRENISVVPQDGALFGGTIRDNIAYGNPEATDEDIARAARDAYIHDFIAALPGGYDTIISERGVSLSGGQRQRLAIARALIKDAPIVVLDEPTTGLDAESEHSVLKALTRLLVGRTALVIAHRLDTIRRADVILVIKDGRIIEQGTHDELLTRAGQYRELYRMQFYEPDEPAAASNGSAMAHAGASS
ncbi:MAG: ABC transporter ATP-binding protein/permease [Chloroflexota bacterium]|nr:ABC transporter ATP-binding protein/permease [Chloroflexota bacterium]